MKLKTIGENAISGVIHNHTSAHNNEIIVEIINPSYYDWFYPNIMAKQKLANNCHFYFNGIQHGRVTFLRVYTRTTINFKEGLRAIWNNWFGFLSYSTLKHWKEEKYSLCLWRYFYSMDVYHIIPLLKFENNIEIDIYPENAQEYCPSWSQYLGEFAFKNKLNESNYIEDEINKLLIKHYKETNKEVIMDFKSYKKKFGNEVYCIGAKWMNKDDTILMPLAPTNCSS